jgi:hypothetical protein
MAASLITLAQAKAHLYITLPDGDPGDADLQLKLDQAEAIIRGRLKTQNDPAWTPTTVPGAITSAILLLLGELHEHRGDDAKNNADVWRAIDNLLSLYRDPALA